ncbi:ribbon-helix-helix protein, CopG family [Halomonas alimentaria]|uniref:Ribbon-helix-helix protein, CopG family n=1 Tax=Halomonas alimentaria TaxID=147248 RepID=A0A7X4W5X6_9GAMM|nr:ribbon-helix-helix protein, CopG family [Halomonas alimentaria]
MPTITVRLSEDEKDRLDAAARRARLQTGDAVSLSDLVREALRCHLDRLDREDHVDEP